MSLLSIGRALLLDKICFLDHVFWFTEFVWKQWNSMWLFCLGEHGRHFLFVVLRTAEEFANGHIEGAINIPYMFKVGSGNHERYMMIECFIHVCKRMNLYCICAFGSYSLFNWTPRRTEKLASWELYSNGKKWLKRIVNDKWTHG